MNARRPMELALWAGALVLGVFATLQARSPRATKVAASVAGPRAVSEAGEVATDSDATALVAVDPFRAARHPSPVEYRPELEGAPPPPPRPPRPALAVSGIIGGPPWSAVLEGVPGREGGAVVRGGDTLGGLKVRAVWRDTVIITGMDTTWRLIVRRGW